MNTRANEIMSLPYERMFAAAGVAAFAAGSGAVAYFDPAESGFFPVCPLYSLTGIACPGCGLTRGFHALFHGDVVGALDFNALLPFFVFIIGYFALSMALVAFRGRGLSFSVFKPGLLWAFFAIAVLFAVLRNLPVFPFSVLYP